MTRSEPAPSVLYSARKILANMLLFDLPALQLSIESRPYLIDPLDRFEDVAKKLQVEFGDFYFGQGGSYCCVDYGMQLVGFLSQALKILEPELVEAGPKSAISSFLVNDRKYASLLYEFRVVEDLRKCINLKVPDNSTMGICLRLVELFGVLARVFTQFEVFCDEALQGEYSYLKFGDIQSGYDIISRWKAGNGRKGCSSQRLVMTFCTNTKSVCPSVNSEWLETVVKFLEESSPSDYHARRNRALTAFANAACACRCFALKAATLLDADHNMDDSSCDLDTEDTIPFRTPEQERKLELDSPPTRARSSSRESRITERHGFQQLTPVEVVENSPPWTALRVMQDCSSRGNSPKNQDGNSGKNEAASPLHRVAAITPRASSAVAPLHGSMILSPKHSRLLVLEASGQAIPPARAVTNLADDPPVSESDGQETSQSDDAVGAVEPVVAVPEPPKLDRLLRTLDTQKKKPAKFKPRPAQSTRLEPISPRYNVSDKVLMPLSAVLHPSLSSHFPSQSRPFSLDAPADGRTTERPEIPKKNAPKLPLATDDDGWSGCCRHLCCVPLSSSEADNAGG